MACVITSNQVIDKIDGGKGLLHVILNIMLQFTCLHANLLDLDSAAALESRVEGCFPGLFSLVY